MPDMSQADFDALGAFRMIAQQYGGTPQSIVTKINELTEDNRKYRQEEKPALEAKLPKADEVVVPKADAELLPKYKELGDPKTIKETIEAGTKAQGELALNTLRTSAAAFAKAAGLSEDSVETMIAIPALKDAKFEVRKGKIKDANGRETEGQIAYITLAGDNQKAMQFADAEKEVPALKGLARAGVVTTTQKQERMFVQQSNGQQGGTIYDQIRAERAPKPEAEKTATVPVRPVEDRLGMTR